MKILVCLTLSTLLATPLLAQTPDVQETQPTKAITTPEEDHTEAIGHDLRTLARVTDVAADLDQSRQVLMAIVDSDIERLRSPRGDGTYRWASLQREDGGKVTDEKTIEQVSTEKELRNVTVSAPNAFRVVVTVPSKRGVFSSNNRVWIRNVLVDSTAFDGKISHHEIPVNAWVNPGDAHGVALPDIAASAKATVELGVESGSKRSVAEVALIQARLVDDPASPWYPAVKRLLQIREFTTAKPINRGYLKNALDEALLSLPGELEKRTAEQMAAAEERRRLAATGELKGAIALGDATPDVTAELAEISRLLTGTLEDQADGRTRLDTLRATLAPPPAVTPTP